METHFKHFLLRVVTPQAASGFADISSFEVVFPDLIDLMPWLPAIS